LTTKKVPNRRRITRIIIKGVIKNIGLG